MPPATRHPLRRTLLAVAVVGVAVVTGCSSDGDTAATTTTADAAEAYCDAWAEVITAFEAFDQIDLVAGGTDAIRTSAADLDTAVQQLADAADDQLQPAVEEFTASLDELGTVLTSTDLPVDRRQEVRDAADQVDATWNELVDAFRAGCPSAPATTVTTSG